MKTVNIDKKNTINKLKKGTILKVIANTSKPQLVGEVRIVKSIHTNYLTLQREDGSETEFRFNSQTNGSHYFQKLINTTQTEGKQRFAWIAGEYEHGTPKLNEKLYGAASLAGEAIEKSRIEYEVVNNDLAVFW